MNEIIHIFAFLYGKPRLTLYMDPACPELNYSVHMGNRSEFKEYYQDSEEEMPHKMPRPRGRPVVTSAFVGASHGANKVTRRSHSGYIIFVNRAPVKWMSKRQQTVETSALSSDFIALKQCLEDVEHLRFKLRMFGIPMSEDQPSTLILRDNESVVRNTSNVESSLNKKHSDIAHHFARWNVEAGVCTISWIPTGDNIADVMTNRLAQATRDYLFGSWTY